jgi:hypothetical protein
MMAGEGEGWVADRRMRPPAPALHYLPAKGRSMGYDRSPVHVMNCPGNQQQMELPSYR